MPKKSHAYYAVEEGIPIPAATMPLHSMMTRIYPWGELRVGDSFLIPGHKIRSAVMWAAKSYASRRNIDWEYTMFRVEDGNWRVWRIK